MIDLFFEPVTFPILLLMRDEMREEDKNEALAAGHTPGRALLHSFMNSAEPLSVWSQDMELLVIFGITHPDVQDTSKGLMQGNPWLCGTNSLKKYPRELLAASNQFMATNALAYSVLENYVHDKNEQAKTYLDYLGFTLDEQPTINPNTNEPFIHFHWENPICASSLCQ
jgi:hypothetical protein